MKKTFAIGCMIAVGLIVQGCTNTVKYGETSASKAVEQEVGTDTITSSSLEMLEHMMADANVQKATKSGRPMLAVFGLINFTHDKPDLAAINGKLMNELNKANRFRFADQAAMSSESENWKNNLYPLFDDPANGQRFASAVSADYLLVGEISNIIRTEPKTKRVYYRVTLKLLDQESGAFLWQEQREILKSEKAVIYGI